MPAWGVKMSRSAILSSATAESGNRIFFQAHQLVNAGTRPHLQFRNSLRVLNLLAEDGLITAADRQTLDAAYRFLRMVEHRIQIVQEQQTHLLPAASRDCDVLARRCGFVSRQAFMAELSGHRQAVSEVFKDLFHSAAAEEQAVRPEVHVIFDRAADPDLVKDILEEKGFSNPDAAFASLQYLRDGDPHKRLTRRAAQPRKTGAAVDERTAGIAQPGSGVEQSESFLNVIRARDSFFAC